MAKYAPITKTLKKATPTARSADGIVKSWDIEVVYSYAGDEENNLPAWKTSYSENEDVEYMEKTVDQFTKAELIGFMSPMIENHIFEAHYESQNLPATEERVSNFDINSLN
jgi:Rps23 Pro-64 3,4-dihydroxylase Tpa1-like proline 4-hydroxylase